jgi:hypothetical protein
MKTNLYTKAVLTVIALALVMIACNEYVHPETTASAQSALLGGVLVTGGDGAYSFLDTRTGDLWTYGWSASEGDHYEWSYLGKITKMGQPLTGGAIDPNGHRKNVTLR